MTRLGMVGKWEICCQAKVCQAEQVWGWGSVSKGELPTVHDAEAEVKEQACYVAAEPRRIRAGNADFPVTIVITT